MTRLKIRWLVLGLFFVATLSLAETWTIGADGGYEPWTDPSLPGGGMSIEIVRRALAKQGDDIKVEWLPWKRAKLLVEDGVLDGSVPWSLTKERTATLRYSELFTSWETILVSNDENLIHINDGSEKFIGRSLCVPLGWKIPPIFSKLVEKNQMVLSRPRSNKVDCYVLALLGRVDVFTVTGHRYSAIRRMALEKVKGASGKIPSKLRPVFKGNSLDIKPDLGGLITGKKNPNGNIFIQRFNAGYRQLQNSGELAKIIAGYDIF